MEKKRFIFDLDHTLMTANYGEEKEYFENIFGDDSKIFINNPSGTTIAKLLYEYERIYKNYDINQLSEFLTLKTGLDFNREVIIGWIESFGRCSSVVEEGVIDTLEYLKHKDYSLVILTNWFLESQMNRIKNSELCEYFDGIYAGDIVLKPRKEAYINAKADFRNHNCIYIGDNLDKDYIGPRSCGIYSILYDKNDIHNKNIVKIKKMNEIKRLY